MPVFVKAGGIAVLQPSSGHASTAGSAPLTLRVFAGQDGHYTMYDDAGTGLGYQHGQYSDTPISYRSGTSTSTLVVGPARGTYPGAPASRRYTVDIVDVSSPSSVLVNGHPVASSGAWSWSYSAATHTLRVPLGPVPVGSSATVTQVGGAAVQSAEPAATQLTIRPADSLTTASGATTTVSTTLANSGPGAVSGASLSLDAPPGWTVTPTTPATSASLAAGSSLTASWSVTAPSAPGAITQTAALSATASYTDAATGAPVTLTAQQEPTPAITSVSPSTASAGQVVTVAGVNFVPRRG